MSDRSGSERAAISAGSPEAADAGAAVLASGGSAADAAIAASAVQCVRELPWCGLGGDAFALVSSPDGAVEALNGAGAAPRALATASIPGGALPRFGPLSISVPGLVDAWWRLWERHGTRPFEALMEPAATLADEGFTLDAAFAGALGRVRAEVGPDDALVSELCHGNGSAPGEGFRLPALARTLRQIGACGPPVFYEGALAGSVARTVSGLGGLLGEADLAAHSCDFEPPLTARYGLAEVSVTPPVSMGWVLLQQLMLYERLGGPRIDGEADRIDLMVRCKHAAFADLASMARWQEAADVAAVLDAGALDRWCSRIDEARRSGSPPSVVPPRTAAAPADGSGGSAERRESRGSTPVERSGGAAVAAESDSSSAVAGSGSAAVVAASSGADTTCLSVVDGRGMMVTFIHSLFNEFGSRVVVPGTGIVLNDRLAKQPARLGGSSASPGPRRPLHTLVGYHLRDGVRRLVGATPGGRGQVQTNFQVLRAIIDDGAAPQAAVDAPRWLSGAPRLPGADDLLFLEPGFDDGLAAELARRGHAVADSGAPPDADLFGSCTIAGLDTRTSVVCAAADHRRSAALALATG